MKMRSGKKNTLSWRVPALSHCTLALQLPLFHKLSAPRLTILYTGDARQEIGDVELKCDVARSVCVKRHAP
jgi:hypothetical protein